MLSKDRTPARRALPSAASRAADSIRVKLARFARKSPAEKRVAIRATLRYFRRRSIKDWPSAVVLAARFVVTRSKIPECLVFHGLAPGDDLMCTTVLRELRQRGRGRLAIVSNHPELFSGNDDASYVFPAGNHYSVTDPPLSVYRHFAQLFGGEFRRVIYAPFDGKDQSESPTRHVVADMCASAGISGRISIRPYLTLNDDEKARAAWARGRVVIQSSGLTKHRPILNKQWYPERFQGVVDALHREVEFIQLGSADDPLLRHVKDLRGATTMRESAAVLYHAQVNIGYEGFPMHLARAVDCPSVIVYGGRVAPWQLGYICNVNLYSAVPCAPCWRWNLCDYDRICMKNIAVEDVVLAARQMLEKPRNPLAIETIEI